MTEDMRCKPMSAVRCKAWLDQFAPESSMAHSTIIKLAKQRGSGLRARVMRSQGLCRKWIVLVTPQAVMDYVEKSMVD